jgi:hypothetical protein
MSREQFIKAERRVRGYLCLVLLLTAWAAIGLAFALPGWTEGREWLRAHRGEGSVRFLFVLLVEAVVLGPLLLIPLVSVIWLNHRFGLRCPGCKRSVTLRGRSGDVLRSGRCCWCQQTLFQQSDGE